MTEKKDFETRYQTGDLPWDTGEHDRHLEQVVKEFNIQSCPVLELGAGTGSDALWLAGKGFSVTAVDLSPTAVKLAREKAESAGVETEVLVADVMKDEIPGGPYDFVFDRGCFHIFDLPEERSQLAEIVWKHLSPGGNWFSIIGSTDGPERDEGPPRRSVLDIASAVEPFFEIMSLKTTTLDTNLSEPPRAWVCFMRRRNESKLTSI